MKLIRFGNSGNEKPGLQIDDKTGIDASSFGEDYNENFFATDGLSRLAKWFEVNKSSAKKFELTSVRLGPPVARPSKMVCIGLNYRKHAIEAGLEIPKEPVIFLKATSAIVGPNDNLMIPRDSHKTDYEVEFAIVIGKRASYVEKANALNYIAGYMLHNDYSEREYQLERGGQWTKGKGCDTFAPLGPFLLTRDEISDTHDLDIWTKVNGKIMQQGTTGDMIFDVSTIISYVTQFMTLLPGDVISTGTPHGGGIGLKPPVYLKPGDVVEIGIEGLGTSTQHVVEYKK
ncbi:2-hydroxyhepta-2,4-diene-1,7-dioate isomerase [Cytophagales bacterium WSM2-2]|nr:2-hydroxyhepta-2,4-diene-1,7-dioate isomerase [Cytophagales bacterium WSM2-2]